MHAAMKISRHWCEMVSVKVLISRKHLLTSCRHAVIAIPRQARCRFTTYKQSSHSGHPDAGLCSGVVTEILLDKIKPDANPSASAARGRPMNAREKEAYYLDEYKGCGTSLAAALHGSFFITLSPPISSSDGKRKSSKEEVRPGPGSTCAW